MPPSKDGTAAVAPPLPLYQVLEEEYERINRKPPPSRDEVEKKIAEKNIRNAGSRSDLRLDAVFKDIHNARHAALCLSGGGIRSATFALGVLQGLARRGLLKEFHYLSTVSGGGYAGGWLSAWIHRHHDGVQGVVRELSGSATEGEKEAEKEPAGSPDKLFKLRPGKALEPEPEQLAHLRNYSNYLTPSLGIFSADTWTVGATIVRNLILNWLVLVPLLLLALAVPRIVAALAQFDPAGHPLPLALALGVGFLGGVVSAAYAGIKRPSTARVDNEWKGFLIWCMGPLVTSAGALTLLWAWLNYPGAREGWRQVLSWVWPDALATFLVSYPLAAFVLFGALLYFFGWLLYTVQRWRDGVSESLKHRFYEFLAMLVSGAGGGFFLWVFAAKIFYDPHGALRPPGPSQYDLLLYVALAPSAYLTLFFLSATLFAGVFSEHTNDEDREWWARFSGWLLVAILAWAAVSFLVLVAPLYLVGWYLKVAAPAGGLIGLLTAYLARSMRTPAADKKGGTGGWRGLLLTYALPLGAFLFIALLLVLLSFGTNYLLMFVTFALDKTGLTSHSWLHHGDLLVARGYLSVETHSFILKRATLPLLLIFVAALVVLSLVFSRLINTNKFSQHAMYRNRLIRAYLGASNRFRNENRFTGFDPEDNLPMHHLRPEMFHPGSFRNVGEFAQTLRKKENSLHEAILKKMSVQTQDYIKNLAPDKEAPKALLQVLLADLNGPEFLYKSKSGDDFVYEPDAIFDNFPFRAEELTGDARTLYLRWQFNKLTAEEREELPEGQRTELRPDEIMLFNRRLLEWAFNKDKVRDKEIIPCPAPPHRPLHVINIALNLVQGKRLAWQDRKAQSFTVSPLHCGSCQIPDREPDEEECDARGRPRERQIYGSYRRAHLYGGKDTGGISLGTAVAVSGAAVSPNMGYYSSPLVTFLMTLFNVRLGWWLGNPGKHGAGEYHRPNPKLSARPIIAEALGLTNDESPYVYLSDGGHFENLGLYEMVLRRCKTIVVSDASDDFEFQYDNLGNAVRKIRIDFGIPIEFERVFIYPRSKGSGGAFCAVGRIKYSQRDIAEGLNAAERREEARRLDGMLVYIKPVFYGANEPVDVHHYARANERFPHESTVDQWFSEEQFESYRALGEYIMRRVMGERDPGSTAQPDQLTLEEFRKKVEEHVDYYKNQADRNEARLAIRDVNELLDSVGPALKDVDKLVDLAVTRFRRFD